jgi:hypothetical protein
MPGQQVTIAITPWQVYKIIFCVPQHQKRLRDLPKILFCVCRELFTRGQKWPKSEPGLFISKLRISGAVPVLPHMLVRRSQ